MPQLVGTMTTAMESFKYSANADFGDTEQSFNFVKRLKLTTGTGVGQADVMYNKVITLAANGAIALDMSGTTNDPLNINIAMVSIVGLCIVNASPQEVDGLATLTIGGGSNTIVGLFGANAQQLKLPPGGQFQMACGGVGGIAQITAGTADILNITNGSGGASTFQIFIVGRSA